MSNIINKLQTIINKCINDDYKLDSFTFDCTTITNPSFINNNYITYPFNNNKQYISFLKYDNIYYCELFVNNNDNDNDNDNDNNNNNNNKIKKYYKCDNNTFNIILNNKLNYIDNIFIEYQIKNDIQSQNIEYYKNISVKNTSTEIFNTIINTISKQWLIYFYIDMMQYQYLFYTLYNTYNSYSFLYDNSNDIYYIEISILLYDNNRYIYINSYYYFYTQPPLLSKEQKKDLLSSKQLQYYPIHNKQKKYNNNINKNINKLFKQINDNNIINQIKQKFNDKYNQYINTLLCSKIIKPYIDQSESIKDIKFCYVHIHDIYFITNRYIKYNINYKNNNYTIILYNQFCKIISNDNYAYYKYSEDFEYVLQYNNKEKFRSKYKEYYENMDNILEEQEKLYSLYIKSKQQLIIYINRQYIENEINIIRDIKERNKK